MKARRHHHTTRAYLAGFTLEGSPRGRLFVLDLSTGGSRMGTPNSEGVQRDYYRVKGPDPNAFEAELGRIESAALPVIREVHASLRVPTGASLEALLTFVASMACRTPPHRNHVNRAEEQFLGVLQDMYAAHPEALTRLKERTPTAGDSEADHHSREFLEHLESPRIELSSSWAVERLRMWMRTELPWLRRMTWGIAAPHPGAGLFICSDMAAVLHNPSRTPYWIPPGFGDREAEFTMPLSKVLMLVGRYGGTSTTYLFDRRVVAGMNERTTRYADHVYAPTENFLWMASDGRVGDRSTLLEAVAEGQARAAEDDEEGVDA